MNGRRYSRRALLVAAGGGLVSLAGCTTGDDGGDGGGGSDGDDTRTPTEEPTSSPDQSGFRIEKLDFAAEEAAGYEQYTPQPEATFEPGERVWFYVGLREVPADDGTVRLTLSVTVRPPEGTGFEPVGGERTFSKIFADRSEVEMVHLTSPFDLTEDIPDGEYVVEATVTDDVTGASDTLTRRFFVES